MKKIFGAAAVVLLVLSLSACGDSVSDIKEQGKIAQACKDAGGRPVYDGFNQLRCSFDGVN